MLRRMHGGARRWMWRAAALSGVVGCASWAFAEPVGSPAGILKKGKWAMGLGGSGLQRGLTGSSEALIYQAGHFRGYGLTDRLSLYGKIGGAYLEVEDPSILTTDSPTGKHSFGAGVMVGVGLKGKIWESATKGWEWDGSVQYVDVRARHRTDNDGHWREWVVATNVAKSVGRLKPYGGLKVSIIDFDAKIRQGSRLLKQEAYEADTRVGPFFGTDVYFGDQEDVIMNVETSYLDGVEVTLAIQYLF